MHALFEAGDKRARPDQISFSAVINTWAKSRRKDAGARAEDALKRMDEFAKGMGDVELRPNTISYTAVLDAWAKCGDPAAPERAEAILIHMLKLFDEGNVRVMPNATSFNTVINAWAKARRKDSGERAEEWVERLYGLGKRTNDEEQRPDTTTFSATLDAWAKSGNPDAPEKAEALLNRMLELYEGGMEQVKPDVISFNTGDQCLGTFSAEGCWKTRRRPC